jgi:hypothetical protein
MEVIEVLCESLQSGNWTLNEGLELLSVLISLEWMEQTFSFVFLSSTSKFALRLFPKCNRNLSNPLLVNLKITPCYGHFHTSQLSLRSLMFKCEWLKFLAFSKSKLTVVVIIEFFFSYVDVFFLILAPCWLYVHTKDVIV